MPTKKSAPKKVSSKKSAAKKKETKKSKGSKPRGSKAVKAAPPKIAAGPASNCKCLKRLSKYYCYHLVNGGWERAAATGYPTKAMCEENCCA